MILTAQVDGSEVLTVEGLEVDGRLHPLQEAFIKHHAIQCGFVLRHAHVRQGLAHKTQTRPEKR